MRHIWKNNRCGDTLDSSYCQSLVGMCGAVLVVSRVGFVVVLKGRSQVREGRLDCACNQWFSVSGSTVFASSYTDCKAPDQPDSLMYCKPIEVGVSFDAHCL